MNFLAAEVPRRNFPGEFASSPRRLHFSPKRSNSCASMRSLQRIQVFFGFSHQILELGQLGGGD